MPSLKVVMPEDELAIYQQNMKQRLKVNLKKSDFIAGRLIDAYGWSVWYPTMAGFGFLGGCAMLLVMRKQQLLAKLALTKPTQPPG